MASNLLSSVAIGIDLGTTYTCVGIFENGGVQILNNRDGKKTTPSCVAFTEDRRIIGESAKNYGNMHPEQVIYDSKRLIGRQFRDECVQKDRNIWPFTVVNVEGKPKVHVKYKEVLQSFAPEQISAMLLQEIKDVSEKYLGFPIKEAVITVPAYFTDAQRKATKIAGEIAQFKVLGILNEPTAAALAYGFHNQTTEERKILVYDFGGGTFDVSLLSVTKGNFHVISTGGDSHLGGQDIDNLLVKNLKREFQRIHGLELSRTGKEIRRLRTACEKAKVQLSTQSSAMIELDSLMRDKDLTFNMTRIWFEDICEDLFRATLKIVEDTLERGKIDKSKVADVILVGGSTRIPMVKDMLTTFFDGKEPHRNINPDEAVAYGAAIQAAILTGVQSSEVNNLSLHDVTPLSLGIGTKGGIMATLIKRNTPTPATKKQLFSTSINYQSYIQFEVFEGERPLIKDNILLDQFTLSGIPPALKGVPLIQVTFKVDEDGILKVSAEDPVGEHRKELLIDSRNSLTPDAIAKAINIAEEMKKDDQLQLNKIQSRDSLEIYAQKIEETIKNDKIKEKITKEELQMVTEKLQAFKELWERSDREISLSDYDNFRNELEEIWNPITRAWYPGANTDMSFPAIVPEAVQSETLQLPDSSWYEVRYDGIKLEGKDLNL